MPDADELAHSRAARAVGEVLNNPWELTRGRREDRIARRSSITRAHLWSCGGARRARSGVDAGSRSRASACTSCPFAGPRDEGLEITMPRRARRARTSSSSSRPATRSSPDLAAHRRTSSTSSPTHRARRDAAERSLPRSAPRAGRAPTRGHVAARLPRSRSISLRPPAPTRPGTRSPRTFATSSRSTATSRAPIALGFTCGPIVR